MTHDEHILSIAMDIDAKMQTFKALVIDITRQTTKLIMLLRASDTLRDSLVSASLKVVQSKMELAE